MRAAGVVIGLAPHVLRPPGQPASRRADTRHMAEAPDNVNDDREEAEADHAEPALDSDPAPSIGGSAVAPPWSQVWQLPVLLLGVLLFVFGVYLSLPEEQKYDFGSRLDAVARYEQANNLDEAEALLDDLRAHVAEATPKQQVRLAILDADFVYLKLADKAYDHADNHKLIVNLYEQVRRSGRQLDGSRLERLAEMLVALERDEQALAVLDELKSLGEPAQRRYRVIRQIIERTIDRKGYQLDEFTPLLERFQQELRAESDPSLRRPQEIWAADQRSRMLLAAGDPQRAVDALIRKIFRLVNDGGDEDLAPLQILLGKAYQQVGQLTEARRSFNLADQRLASIDPLQADVLVGLAQIALADEGDLQTALGLFGKAETDYPTTPVYIEALMGRADVEARLGGRYHPDALEHFGRAVEDLKEDARLRARHLARLRQMVLSHYDVLFDTEDYDRALDYLSLLTPLFDEPDMPADVLARLAVTDERIAEQLLGEEDGAAAADPDDSVQAQSSQRAARKQAAIHFGRAARYYEAHAARVTTADDEAHGESLWKAAICYDRGHYWQDAVRVYGDYAESRPSDPRHLEAKRRVGWRTRPTAIMTTRPSSSQT